MKDPKQKMRFTDTELSVIKGLFADNDELLHVLRKVLLQFELNEKEKETLQRSFTPASFPLLKKFFNPELDPDSPLFQMTDLILGLDIKNLTPDEAWPFIKAKETEVKYIEQQLNVIQHIVEGKEPFKTEILLSDLSVLEGTKPTREAAFSRLIARNFLLSFIDSNIQQIKFLAGLKEETVEQTKERLRKDSNK